MRCALLFSLGLAAVAVCAQDSKRKLGTSSEKAQGLFDRGFAVGGNSNGDMRIYQAFELDSVPIPPEGSFSPRHCPVQVPDSSCARGGKVYVSFIVERDGSCSSARVTQHVCPQFDAAALCTVEHWTHWKPGSKHGSPVRTRMVLPMDCDPR